MPLDIPRRALVASLVDELQETRLLLLVGPRGAGKSDLLRRLHGRLSGPRALVQLEPLAATPGMLAEELRRLTAPILSEGTPTGRPPFRSLLEDLAGRPADSLLLLDDVTELRTLSHYPDVERPLESFLEALAASGRAVATSRFSFWMRREHPALETRALPPVGVEELEAIGVPEAGALVVATAGLAHHVARLAETMSERDVDLEAGLALELAPGGRVEAECRATLAELLLRARGYAACKAVLRILADEEGLKLTEVARRMDRTPGSARDYLRWLEEVDLVRAIDKRFYFVDPLVRLWCRVYGRGVPAEASDRRDEIARYLDGLSPATPSGAVAPSDHGSYTLPPPPSEDLVEID